MSVLVRQSGGMNSVCSFHIVVDRNDLPVPDRIHGPDVLLYDDIARLAFPAHAVTDQHSVACVDELVRFSREPLPHREPIAERLANALTTSPRAAASSVRQIMPLRVLVKGSEGRFVVPCVERPDYPQHKLHVRLRHRPRSISQAQELA